MLKFMTLFHASLLFHHIYVIKYTKENINYKSTHVDVQDLENYRFRYLTTWNMILQAIYLTLALYTDIPQLLKIEKSHSLKIIEKIKGYIFTSLVFPTGLVVSGIFWTLFNIDRELVYPLHLDSIIPIWVNHSIHTIILALPLLEVLFYRKVPSFKTAFIGMSIFSAFYFTTYIFTYYESSRWLYKVFNILSWPERLVFIAGNYIISTVALWIGITIQTYIISRSYKQKTLHKTMSKKLL